MIQEYFKKTYDADKQGKKQKEEEKQDIKIENSSLSPQQYIIKEMQDNDFKIISAEIQKNSILNFEN